MNTDKKDFVEEYRQQTQAFKPWAFVTLFIFVAIVLGLPIAFMIFEIGNVGIFIYILLCLLGLIAMLPVFIKVLKCPSCKKWMGRDVGKFCPLCGVRIRN